MPYLLSSGTHGKPEEDSCFILRTDPKMWYPDHGDMVDAAWSQKWGWGGGEQLLFQDVRLGNSYMGWNSSGSC